MRTNKKHELTIDEKIEEEAREQAKKIEEKQTLGVYDDDDDYSYDRGWNAGEVSGYEDGYIAGAKAHQIRWHDLRKNPKDLPDTDRYVCVSNGEDWTKASYSEGRWKIVTLVGFGFAEIILWCDISV